MSDENTPPSLRQATHLARRHGLAAGLLGYDTSQRSSTRHVAPTREHAELVLDGTCSTAQLTAELQAHLTEEG